MKTETNFKKVNNNLAESKAFSKVEKDIISLIQSFESNDQLFYATNGSISKRCGLSIMAVINNLNKLQEDGIISKKVISLQDVNDSKVLSTWCHSRTKEARYLSINETVYNQLINGKMTRKKAVSKAKLSKKNVELNETIFQLKEEQYKATIAQLEAKIVELESQLENCMEVEVDYNKYNIVLPIDNNEIEHTNINLLSMCIKEDVKLEQNNNNLKTVEMETKQNVEPSLISSSANVDYGKESAMNMSNNRIKFDNMIDDIIADKDMTKQLLSLFQHSNRYERGFEKFIAENSDIIIKFCEDKQRIIPAYLISNVEVKVEAIKQQTEAEKLMEWIESQPIEEDVLPY